MHCSIKAPIAPWPQSSPDFPRLRPRSRWQPSCPGCASPSGGCRWRSRWPTSAVRGRFEAVTGTLSRFADACVSVALRFLLRSAAAETSLASLPAERLEAETGLVVLAMGKYGACELNYSSDIDLIVFYDADRFPFRKRDNARGAAVDLVKGLVKLLSEVTVEGYVFRVDLRLRPDAGATQVAISDGSRRALLRGNGPELGTRRADQGARLRRRSRRRRAISSRPSRRSSGAGNLDYAAIEDIHSIKRQIHAHEGHGEIAVARSQRQARPRRHPRDRILRADAAADPWRPRREPAVAVHPGCAARAGARAVWSAAKPPATLSAPMILAAGSNTACR